MTGKVASERIYVDADGNVVDESDPAAAFLAVAEGRPIPDRIIIANGNRVIIEIDEPEDDADEPDDKPASAAKKATKRKSAAKKATKSEASEPEVVTDGGE